MKVCIPDELAAYERAAAMAALRRRGHEPIFGSPEAPAEAILTGGVPLTGDAVAKLPRLSAVVRFAQGRHDIAHESAVCGTAGIPYRRLKGVSSRSTAEHTIMLMLAVLRRLQPAMQGLRDGGWPGRILAELGIGDLGDATVGLIGLGNVGSHVARLLHAFGATVLYNKRHRLAGAEEARLGATFAELDALIERADIISLHTRLGERNSPILDACRLDRMRTGGIVINTGDGRDVDLDALIARVRAGRLAAGLDVFPSEPWRTQVPLPENLVLTPHIAGRSLGTTRRIFEEAAAALDELTPREIVL